MGQHSGLLLVIALSTIVFCIALTFNVLASIGNNGLFNNCTGSISDTYPTELTPAEWTFSIWWIIYFCQGSWLIYLLTTTFRHNSHGDYLYVSPGVIPWGVHVFYITANICNIVWLFLWTRQYMIAAFLILSLIPFTLFFATLIAARSLTHKTCDMIHQGLNTDIWLNRILVHNGLAIYAAWTIIATLVNLTVVLIYASPLQATIENASTAALAILTFELALWTCLDLLLFDAYTRYLIAPYFVALWIMIGVVEADASHDSRNRVFSVILLILAIMIFVLKILLMIYRSMKSPCEEAQPLNRKSNIADK